MKPFHHICTIDRSQLSRRRRNRRLDCTEQNYRTNPTYGGGGAPPQRPERSTSFRDISLSFSKREQIKHFAAEGAMFLIMCVTAAASLRACAAAFVQFVAVQ